MSEIAKRVAARALKAEGFEAEADVVAKLPGSKPGMQMFKAMLDDVNKAYEAGDDAGFEKALESLWNSHEKLNPRR